MTIDFHDPYLAPGIEKSLGYRRADSLEQLLARVDVASLHTPVTAETSGMIDDRRLAAARPGLLLINTSRGHRPGRDRARAARRHPRRRGRMVITPHAAFYAPGSLREMRRMAAANVVDYLCHGRLRTCVKAALLGLSQRWKPDRRDQARRLPPDRRSGRS